MTEAEGTVAVTLLGGVSVRRDGAPVRVASTRVVALLGYLVASAPAAQPRAHLAGLFWPDTADTQARTNLRRELHQLRHIVPEEALDVTDTSIGWRDTDRCRVDVRSFVTRSAEVRSALAAVGPDDALDADLAERGQDVVDSYTGAFLPGSYDDWALEARDLLLRRCIELCDDLVSYLGSRDAVAATELARRRIQLEPLEETGYRQLMALQVAARDRAGALTTYHRCAAILEEQLGVAPTVATSALLTSIIELTDGPAVDGTAWGTASAELSASDRGLVGREADVAVVVNRWLEACEGRPGMLLLTGDPGVGKSRLVSELARIVSDEGGAVAEGRCFSASNLALAPVADWLRSGDLAPGLRSLEPVWQTEVQRLVPRLGSDHRGSTTEEDDLSSGRAFVDSWQRHRFYDGLCHALSSVDRPLLLTLDDLHWCDEETLGFIAFLLGTAGSTDAASDGGREPVLVLAAARPDELHRQSGLQARLRELMSAGTMTEHRLEPLSLAATTELAQRLFRRDVEPSAAALLQAASGGYPLYVVEAARGALRGSEPSTPGSVDKAGLGAVLRRRLSELSPQAQRCAALAAAVGRDFPLDLLVEASDEDEVTVVRAVDELWRRHVLRQVDRGYDFTHDLLRAQAYASVDPAQRWLEHRRLAAALQVLHAADLEPVAARLADQLERAGRPAEAVPFYLQAGMAASRIFANAEALRLFRHCLDIVTSAPPSRERDQRELEVRQAMSAPLNALRGYADREVRQTFERSVELAASLDRTDLELASLVGLWAATFVQGNIDASHKIATRAIELADQVPRLANQAHFSLGGTAVTLGRPETAVAELGLACELSPGTVSLTVGSRPEVHARAWVAHAWWLLGDEAVAADEAKRAVDDARSANHPYSLAIAHAYGAVTAQLRDDLELLDEHLEELTALCQRHTYAYYREWALVLGGWRLGGERGSSRIKVGIANLTASGARARMPYWLSLLASAQRDTRKAAAADATLDSAWSAGMQHGDRWWLPEVIRLRAVTKPRGVADELLRRAYAMAKDQSTPVLADRCRADLLARGLPDPAFGDAVATTNADGTPSS